MFILGTVYYVYLLVQGGMTALMYASAGGHTNCMEAIEVSSTKAV